MLKYHQIQLKYTLSRQLRHKADGVEVMAQRPWHHPAKTLATTTVPLLGVTP